MVSTVLPKILFSQYFWWIIAFVLLVTFLFVRKKNPPPFPGARKSIRKFCKKHEKRITKISDIFWICMILLMAYFLYFILSTFRMDFSVLSESESIRTKFIKSDRWFIFSTLIIWSGISGFFVGFLSFFQSNITKIKRIILLIVCLSPIVFTVIQVLIDAIESLWWTIELCLFFSAGSWIINMPTVLVGKSSFELFEDILKKSKLILSHHTD
jgi:hypothetical protein